MNLQKYQYPDAVHKQRLNLNFYESHFSTSWY